MRKVTARPLPAAPLVCAPMLVLLSLLPGCGKKTVASAPPPPRPVAPALLSDVDLKGYKPNEAGAIMILMYHRINPREPNTELNRTPEQFRKDLETLYKRGYRPVTVSEIVENRMDLPPGKSPVAITFDDSLPTQFRIVTGRDGQQHIDGECAVGILETFSKSHPDWPMKATFFVLPKEGRNGEPFGQAEWVEDKFAYLVKKGYEIGNHTARHAYLNRLDAAGVQAEIATAVRDIKQINPGAQMLSLAVPYSKLPPKNARARLVTGEAGGTRYENKAVLMAAWRPVASPACKIGKKVSDQVAPFDPYHLERVLPNPRQANVAGTFEYWLKYFDQNPGERYVSDGNPQIVAVPKSLKSRVDEARLKKEGRLVQFYSPGGSSTGEGGRGDDNLSVE